MEGAGQWGEGQDGREAGRKGEVVRWLRMCEHVQEEKWESVGDRRRVKKQKEGRKEIWAE